MRYSLLRIAAWSLMLNFCCSGLLAQDPIFSQYFTNPMYLNPALTGMYGGTTFTVNGQKMRYKAGDFLTSSATVSMDAPCIQSAFGLIYVGDRAGDAPLKRQRMGLTWAWYPLPARGDMYTWDLSFGIAGTYNRTILDLDGLTFSDQLHAIYGRQGASQVDLSGFGGDDSFFDLDAGLDFWQSVGNQGFSYNMGLTVNHLVRVDPSPLNTSDTLARRFTGYWQGVLEMKYDRRSYWIIPLVKVDLQRGSRQWTQRDSSGIRVGPRYESTMLRRFSAGALFALRPGREFYSENVGFWGGFMLHNSNFFTQGRGKDINTLTVMMGFTWYQGNSDWRIGLSYDYDYAGTRSDTGGIFELSAMVTLPDGSVFCRTGGERGVKKCPVPGMRSSKYSASPRNRLNY